MSHPDHEIRSRAEAWLASLPSDGAKPQFDADGRCTLATDNGSELSLMLMPEEAALSIYVPMLGMEGPNPLPLFAYALSLNIYQRLTQGGVIALDPTAGKFVYCQRLAVETLPSLSAQSTLQTAHLTAATLAVELRDYALSKQGGPTTALASESAELLMKV